METDSNNEENVAKESTTSRNKKPTIELNSILGYIALLSAGFGFAILLLRFGVFQIDNPNVKPISEFNTLQTELSNMKSKMTKIRHNIIDSISIETLILDTDFGKDRLKILKQELGSIPFFIPTTATTIGGLTEEEKLTDLLIAHWHAYREGNTGQEESELILMKTLKEVNQKNPKASFVIYSSLLGNSIQIEKLKSQIPNSINPEQVIWIEFSYKPSDCQIQEVIHKILAFGKGQLPK